MPKTDKAGESVVERMYNGRTDGFKLAYEPAESPRLKVIRSLCERLMDAQPSEWNYASVCKDQETLIYNGKANRVSGDTLYCRIYRMRRQDFPIQIEFTTHQFEDHFRLNFCDEKGVVYHYNMRPSEQPILAATTFVEPIGLQRLTAFLQQQIEDDIPDEA